MSKRSILVVDDDQSVRSYLSDFLTSCGYVVECAESGDEAVARLTAVTCLRGGLGHRDARHQRNRSTGKRQENQSDPFPSSSCRPPVKSRRSSMR